jgi:succinate dehydrogenase hydrophobic anchor subunit
MYREHKTVFAEVKKVERTHRNYVKIIFEHQRVGEDNFVLSPDSVELINLLTYYSVENPKDLVGEKIILDSSSFSDLDSTVIIPHNVAWNGKLRFAMFSFFSDLNEKSKWQKLFNNGENASLFVIFLFPCTVLSLLGVLTTGVFPELLVNLLQIPIVLWCALVIGYISYVIFRLIILSILSVLDSDFEEV